VRHQRKASFQREDVVEPAGLLGALRQLFPDLQDFPSAELVEEVASGEANHHAILRDFRPVLREQDATDRQIAGLAGLVDASLTMRDDLENAWMTCFFERRARGGPLWSRLSPDTKKHIRQS
jgi:hypothetical protein